MIALWLLIGAVFSIAGLAVGSTSMGWTVFSVGLLILFGVLVAQNDHRSER